jgi:hypothetical protein
MELTESIIRYPGLARAAREQSIATTRSMAVWKSISLGMEFRVDHGFTIQGLSDMRLLLGSEATKYPSGDAKDSFRPVRRGIMQWMNLI